MPIFGLSSLTTQQQQPSQSNNANQTAVDKRAEPAGPDAVEPSKGASEGKGSDSSTSYSGSGAGAGSQQTATVASSAPSAPQASAESVVEARKTSSESPAISEDAARRAAVNLMQMQKTEALIEELSVKPETRDLVAPASTEKADAEPEVKPGDNAKNLNPSPKDPVEA